MASTTSDGAGSVIGCIGLGIMGTGMAKNIQKHLSATSLPSLQVFNRTASKCAPLEELDAKKCDSVPQIAQACNIIFISVRSLAIRVEHPTRGDQLTRSMQSSADAAVISILDQALSSGEVANKIFIDTTTVHPDTTKAVAATVTSRGAKFAALPVFGASLIAEAGKLLAAFAGSNEVLAEISPFIKDVFAREILFVAPEPEKALLLKTNG
jgi:3-hydroxyisobutyrate dehydrogenase-like beta-hydroxyacid dehydrogenase